MLLNFFKKHVEPFKVGIIGPATQIFLNLSKDYLHSFDRILLGTWDLSFMICGVVREILNYFMFYG